MIRLPEGWYRTEDGKAFVPVRLVRLETSSWGVELYKGWCDLFAKDGWVVRGYDNTTNPWTFRPLTEEELAAVRKGRC